MALDMNTPKASILLPVWMKRKTLILLSAVLTLCPAYSAQEPPERKPNIVLVMADDLGWGDAGCMNPASKIPTPNLDRVAAAGMRFLDAHSPSAVCTPTRYGLLTGRYAWRTHLKAWVLGGASPALIEEGRTTLASMLSDAGYYTMGIGKWHLGLGLAKSTDFDAPLRPGPVSCGFDTYFGIPASLDMPPYVWILDEGLVQAPTGLLPGEKHRRQDGLGFYRKGAAAPDFRMHEVLPRVEQKAVEWIERAQRDQPEQPFFLYLALPAPHTPWVPVAPHLGASEAGWYGDFVHQVDGTVGSVLAALRRTGFADNTLLIVTSDNGSHWLEKDERTFGHMANGDWRGQKADIHEGGHRVPFLVRWPGKTPAGSVCPDLVCLTDVFATLAELVEHPLGDAEAEDSISLLPALRGEESSGSARKEVVHHSGGGMFAVRSGPWKLILGLGSGGFTQPKHIKATDGGPKGQLYHLERDPKEEKNLWSEQPEVVARLTEKLNVWRDSGSTR